MALLNKDSFLYPKTCVYGLFLRGELRYVGQTVNLAGRLLEHVQRRQFDQVWYLEMPAKQLDSTERFLILQMNPPENVTVPGGGYRSSMSTAYQISQGIKKWHHQRAAYD